MDAEALEHKLDVEGQALDSQLAQIKGLEFRISQIERQVDLLPTLKKMLSSLRDIYESRLSKYLEESYKLCIDILEFPDNDCEEG